VPARAPVMPTVVVKPKPWMPDVYDYSCYVRIENRSKVTLRRRSFSRGWFSWWVVEPPEKIRPGERADIWLQDSPGTVGSNGRSTDFDGVRNLEFAFACPTLGSNALKSPVRFETRVARRAWRAGGVDRSGFPLQARCYVDSVPAHTIVVPPARRPSRP